MTNSYREWASLGSTGTLSNAICHSHEYWISTLWLNVVSPCPWRRDKWMCRSTIQQNQCRVTVDYSSDTQKIVVVAGSCRRQQASSDRCWMLRQWSHHRTHWRLAFGPWQLRAKWPERRHLKQRPSLASRSRSSGVKRTSGRRQSVRQQRTWEH